MRQITVALVFVVALAATLFVSACDSVDNNISEQNPRIKILLTDAPRAEIESAFVTISRIEIVGADDVSQTLSETALKFDLLTLQNGSQALLVETTLNEGVFSYLRLFVEEDAEVTYDDDDASIAELTIPSGFQSGVKILLNDIELNDDVDDQLTLVLDFDVLESFIPAGDSGLLLFKPVVKVKQAEKNGEDLLVE